MRPSLPSRPFLAAILAASVAACGSDGCGCVDAPKETKAPAQAPPSKTVITPDAAPTPPPPVNEYKEEDISVEAEVDRFLKGLRLCVEKKKDCARSKKLGRKMARRALRDARKGEKERLGRVWTLLLGALGTEEEAAIRVEIVQSLSVAQKGAKEHVGALMSLLDKEEGPQVARRLASVLMPALGGEHEAELGRLEAYLSRLDRADPALLAGQVACWSGIGGLAKKDARWIDLALERLGKDPRPQIHVVLAKLLGMAGGAERDRVVGSLAKAMRRSRSLKDISLSSTTIEALGKLGAAKFLPQMVREIQSRHDQVSFLPSAALGLFHLVQHQEAEFDRGVVLGAAQEILKIPGLSLVAYRFSLFAIRDSGHKDAPSLLKSFLKHPNKEVRKIALKALLGVGKASP